MSIDVEVLSETYAILIQHVPQKDRQEAADSLISVLVDMLGDSELQEFGGSDPTLKRSLREYAPEDEDDENLNDDD